MNRPIRAISLVLTGALVLCAFVAQTAWAEVAKNTTAFTCVKGGGSKDFKDAHCDEKVETGKGEYGHVAIENGKTTEVVTVNEKTVNKTTESSTGVLKGTLAGVTVEISCQSFKGEGTFVQEEPGLKQHTGHGSGTTSISMCAVNKPAKCTVAEPISFKVEGVPLEGLGPEKNTMGGELRPAEGKVFVNIVLQNKGVEKCALAEKVLAVEGTAIATSTPSPTAKHTGATAVYTNAMTKETLSIGEKPAELSVSTTVRLKGGAETPLAGTTTT